MKNCKLQHTVDNVEFPSFPMEIREVMRLSLPPNPAACTHLTVWVLFFVYLRARSSPPGFPETLNDEQ